MAACSPWEPRVGPYRQATEETGDDGGLTDADAVLPGEISFRTDIRPLMDRPAKGDPTGKGCKACHYATESSHVGLDLGGLDLSTLGSLRQGGGSTGSRIVVAGKPDESALIQTLKGQYAYASRMPKNGPPFWSEAEVLLVSEWIAEGAKGADDE